MSKIKITNPGLLTTVQDRGRWGYQQYGVSTAGVMDLFSMEVSNRLVGNDPSEGVLEMTLMGIEFEIEGEALMAVCGAQMEGTINGEPLPLWQSISLKDGDEVSLSSCSSGARAYLALSGGFKIPEVLGSKSTYTRAKMGGFKGRKLEAGDEIELGEQKGEQKLYALPKDKIPKLSESTEIRVILGPQDDYFTEEGIQVFLSSEYTVSQDSDRMGYRLKGKEIAHKDRADIISDGICFGAVQVAGDGQPTIMLADRQTTGGYTKIATVISPDLPLLAQMSPGSKLTFKEISIDQAREEYIAWRKSLDQIADSFVEIKKEESEDLNKDQILKLIEYFNSSRLNTFELSTEECSLRMRKGGAELAVEPAAPAVAPVEGASSPQAPAPKAPSKPAPAPAKKKEEKAEDSKKEEEESSSSIEVKAPIAGVCYVAPSEDEAPFVQLGEEVKKGQTLMILEVMKMMNEIKAPEDAVISSIHFENEQKVDQGALLFTLEAQE